MKKIFLITTLIVFSLFSVNIKAGAGGAPTDPVDTNASGYLPCNQITAFDACGDVNGQVTSVIKVLIGLVFVVIIVYGIFLIIKAALTIIRSDGDPAGLQSGVAQIRGVYIGIGIIIIGIFGLIIVIAFFGAGGIVNSPLNAPGNTVIPIITN